VRNIAIIPARSGSKGLKDKNIKILNGKPLIAYTIEAAKESNMFDEIFVSTDSEKYADIAREYGASVPFLRGKELSSDTASSWDVVKDILQQYEKQGKVFDTITLLQPTSPLRLSSDIVAGYEMMNKKNANVVIGVCETDHSPLWCNTLPKDLSLENFLSKELVSLPRQSLPTYYRINGALYITKVDYLKTIADIYSNGCYAYVMNKETSIDIDNELDFMMAETILNVLNKEF
jgi:CMP-N,N'-diacetyllegionaminic acid synthase